jgi:hypothetical protein
VYSSPWKRAIAVRQEMPDRSGGGDATVGWGGAIFMRGLYWLAPVGSKIVGADS